MTNIRDEIARVLVRARRDGISPSLENGWRIIMNDEDFASIVHELGGNLIPLIIDHSRVIRGQVWLFDTWASSEDIESVIRECEERDNE